MAHLRNILCLLALTAIFIQSDAQTLFKSKPTRQLVNDLLPRNEFGISITNCQFTGDPRSISTFATTSKMLPIKSGIIMSTGIASWAGYPNDSGSSGCGMFTPGDKRLEMIAGAYTTDAAILEIEFVANSDSISFEYFFASEEYPEFVNKGVNDVFAFFIEGPGYETASNIAVLPTTGEAISVDNINHRHNSTFPIRRGPVILQKTPTIWQACFNTTE